jgi:hypothetical protein
MKVFLSALVLFAGFGFAQEITGSGAKPPVPPPAKQDQKQDQTSKVLVRRLESVSWNPVRGELSWLVSVWDVSVSTEQPAARERYVMHLDDAVMEFQGEARSFDSTEAKHVRNLMDLISTYAVESTVWWDHEEESTPDTAAPAPKGGDGTKTKDKPGSPDEKSKPAPKAAPSVVQGAIASTGSLVPGSAVAHGQ